MKYVYVLDNSGNPLMPTKRYGWVRRALKSGKAEPVSTVPFTIRLTYEPDTKNTQEIFLGIDPGRTNIGLAAVTGQGECLYAAHCSTRNREIPKLMADRRAHRQVSRRGERLARKRLAKRLGTTMKRLLVRILPGCEEPVQVKDIINTESRFSNRIRPKGWLTPTAMQLMRTHRNLIRQTCRVLPVTDICIEVNRFAFMQLDNPDLRKQDIDFQHGLLYGYEDAKAFIREAQDGKCLLCGNPIEHYHHVVPRHEGGSNTVRNLAGLCAYCHEAVHKDPAAKGELEEKMSGLHKKYAGTSVLNQVIPQLLETLGVRFPDKVHPTYGWKTESYRRQHSITKEHHTDAYCIACSTLDNPKKAEPPEQAYEIRQFRRHDRARIKAQTERIYKFEGVKVATNRRKRMEQKTTALEDWYQDIVKEFGTEEADRRQSVLTVQKSARRYNNPKRIMPGTVFLYRAKRYVMTGQLTGGRYLRAAGCGEKNFPARDGLIVQNNAGLVYLT